VGNSTGRGILACFRKILNRGIIIYSFAIKRGLKTSLLLIIFFLMVPHSLFAEQFTAIKVYDGDTIKAMKNGIEIIVRLVVIDAPEASEDVRFPGQLYSKEAKEYLDSLTLDKEVEIKGYGYQRYNLILGEVFSGGKNINPVMLRTGMAEVYYGENPPKDLDFDPYIKAEKESKALKKGIWAQEKNYISPKEGRKSQRFKSGLAIILYGILEEGEE